MLNPFCVIFAYKIFNYRHACETIEMKSYMWQNETHKESIYSSAGRKNTVMIRKFNETDSDKVMEIWLDSNIKVHSFISQAYWEMAFGFVKRVIPLTEVYVYEEGDTVCGFIGIEDDYISGLFVEEGHKLLDMFIG